MFSEVKSQLIEQTKNAGKGSFICTEIKPDCLDATSIVLIKDIIDTVSKPFFAENFLENSLLYDEPLFVLDTSDNLKCSISQSFMINNSFNMLFGEVNDISFIIGQHVTSCDFIYFPKINYCYIVVHANVDIVSNALKTLESFLNNIKSSKANENHDSRLVGIIISHVRPYHFLYDTTLMVHKLYESGILGKLTHYQLIEGSFVDFTNVYNIDVANNIVSFKDLQRINGEVFFKVGLAYKKDDAEIKWLSERYDNYFLKTAIASANTDGLYETVKKYKSQGYFVLWFGVATEKRSLVNQKELLSAFVNKMSNYHKICIVIDGWTSVRNVSKFDEAIEDLEVYHIIKRLHREAKVFSVIGSDPMEKVSIASLVDFHISSAATGSIWAARFGRKSGVLHTSKVFYQSTTGAHIHNESIYFPISIITDIQESVGKRMDFISYSIDIEKAMNFIENNFPILFSKEDLDLKKLKLINSSNVQLSDEKYNKFTVRNNDPQFIIDTRNIDIRSNKRCILQLKCFIVLDSMVEKTKVVAAFYLDYGNGFSKEDMVSVNLNNTEDSFTINIELKYTLKRIRFDPVNVQVDFIFKGLFYKMKYI